LGEYLTTGGEGEHVRPDTSSSFPQTIGEAALRLREGSITCVDLAKVCIGCIKRLNPLVNALITVTEERALEAAATLDTELQTGKDRGCLHGIPIVHKDLFDTRGITTTLGSKLHENRVPDSDATVVALLEAAGTVLVGKTNMAEFASNGSGKNVFYGDVHNPWDAARSAGGSSSGTAAAVAARLCLGGTGTDTGGSIRIPASWSGIVGMRPTFGLISLAGAFPRASSLDCAGPLGRTVGDVAMLLGAMVGYDHRYPHSIKAEREDYTEQCNKDVKGLRLATVENYSFRDVDPDVASAVTAAIDELSRLGAEIHTVKIPLLTAPLNYSFLFSILLYEFNQVLGNQYRTASSPTESFGAIVRANLHAGAQVKRETYEKALAERPKQLAEFREAFAEADALITPTMPTVAPLLTAGSDIYDRGRQFNIPISYLGLPSISVPCGFTPTGLPIGLLITGDALREGTLIRIAAAYERSTRFYERAPPLHCPPSSFDSRL